MKEIDVSALMKKYGGNMEGPAYRVWEPAADAVAGRWMAAQADGRGGTDGQLRAAIISRTPYCQKMLARLQEKGIFRPVLDDMAQIVGPQVQVIPEEIGAMTSALRKAAAVFVCTGTDAQGHVTGYTLTVGRSHYEAVVALTVLEKSAEVYLKAEILGGGKPLSRFDAHLMRTIYMKKYSKAETAAKDAEEAGEAQGCAADSGEMAQVAIDYSSDRETMLRQQLVLFGKKLVETGLVQGTWGNLSVRLDEKNMLCTPSGLDYTRLTPADMVKVEIERLHYTGDKKPTSEKGLHAAVYQRRADIGAVIHTHAKYSSIFAAARKAMPIEPEEGRAVFGSQVELAGYGLPGTKKLMRQTAEAIGENFGCLMSAHGMVCCGADLATAFANCALLEACGSVYVENRWKDMEEKENGKFVER